MLAAVPTHVLRGQVRPRIGEDPERHRVVRRHERSRSSSSHALAGHAVGSAKSAEIPSRALACSGVADGVSLGTMPLSSTAHVSSTSRSPSRTWIVRKPAAVALQLEVMLEEPGGENPVPQELDPFGREVLLDETGGSLGWSNVGEITHIAPDQAPVGVHPDRCPRANRAAV